MMLLLLALAADPAARVQVEVSPKTGAWVGQRVTLVVTLKTPDLFAGVPAFELPSIPGAIVMPPSGSPVVGSEQIGGDTFTTQRHEFAVYAQRAGRVHIPPFTIRFDTNAGFGKPVIQRMVTTPAIEFEAKAPPGAEKLGTVIAARNLKLTEEWSPDRKSFKAGDAFTHTVTIAADDVPGMVFPPIRFDVIDGLSVYAKDPVVNDKTERGSLSGRRTDSATYVCKVGGTAMIPGRTLTWFDLDAKELKRIDLPGRSIIVSAAAAPASTPAPESTRKHQWIWPAGAAGLIAALAVILAARRRHAAPAESEESCFARVRQACRSGSAHAVYDAMLSWIDHFGATSLDEFVEQAADPVLADSIAELRANLFSPSSVVGNWSRGAVILQRLCLRRRSLLGTQAKSPRVLPMLNPSS